MRDINNICLGCMNELEQNGTCGYCSFAERAFPQLTDALPYRTVLEGRYFVGRAFESNGEGMTYIAYDKVTDSTVRLREYFPEGLCERAPDGAVRVVSGCEYDFNDCMLEFLKLARNLAKMREVSAILPVFDIFESNSTAYYITEHIESITLGDFLKRNNNRLRWSQARPLFMPLLSAIEALHHAGIIHRGISAQTIIIGRDSKLRLIGFCVEDVRLSRSALVPEFFPGFTAIEQYDDEEQSGTWTDIYAFAATLFRTLVGSPPPDVLERAKNDSLIIPADITSEMPKYALTALAYALQIYPEDRTADVEAFRNEISGSPVVSAQAEQAKNTLQSNAAYENDDTDEDDEYDDDEYEAPRRGGGKAVFIAMLLTGVVILIIGALVYFTIFNKDSDSDLSSIASVESAPSFTSSDVSKEPAASITTMVNVFNMVGKSVASANSNELVKNGSIKLKVSTRYDDSYKYGIIIEQSVKNGETVEKGGEVSVVVSLGPQDVAVPGSIIGKTPDQAIIELRLLGFIKENIKTIDREEPSLPYGVVIGTSVATGAKANIFDEIEVYVNSYRSNDDNETE